MSANEVVLNTAAGRTGFTPAYGVEDDKAAVFFGRGCVDVVQVDGVVCPDSMIGLVNQQVSIGRQVTGVRLSPENFDKLVGCISAINKHGSDAENVRAMVVAKGLTEATQDELNAEYVRRFGGQPPIEKFRVLQAQRDLLQRQCEGKDRAHEALVKAITPYVVEDEDAFEIAPWVASKLEELAALKRLQKHPAMVCDSDKVDAKALAKMINTAPAVLYRSVSRHLTMPKCGDSCEVAGVRFVCAQTDFTNQERPVLHFVKVAQEFQSDVERAARTMATASDRPHAALEAIGTEGDAGHWVDPIDLLADDSE